MSVKYQSRTEKGIEGIKNQSSLVSSSGSEVISLILITALLALDYWAPERQAASAPAL